MLEMLAPRFLSIYLHIELALRVFSTSFLPAYLFV